MSNLKMNIEIMPSTAFLKKDGTFDLERALMLSGQIAGVCYDQEGFNHKKEENPELTKKRIKRTIENGHHSVYDHIFIGFNLENVPKILAMVINNEKQYTTSEKSGRYTLIEKSEDSVISDREIELYNKWLNIFEIKIKEKYGKVLGERKIKTLSRENARYMISVFMPTTLIYTTTLRQINYIVSWIDKYISEHDKNNLFEEKLSKYLLEFKECLFKLNVLDERLQHNEKQREFSLFGKDLLKKDEYFGDVYQTKYSESFVGIAQSQRHRTINYNIELPKEEKYYIPPILLDDEVLLNEWLEDISSISETYPNGLLVDVFECGTYENFILKCKERLCSAAQIEIMKQTKETLTKYKKALEDNNNPLRYDIVNYTKGARCTFPGYVCTEPCNFKEGITLKRKI